jgi:hypothetical protein
MVGFLAAIVIAPAAASPSFAPGGTNGGGIFIPFITGGGPAANTSVSAGGQPGNRPQVNSQSSLVELKGDPLSTYMKTRPAPGKKIDFNSSAVKSYSAQLAALRNDFKAWLRSNAPNARITGQFDISLNAVSVQLNGESMQTIASAPQVVRAEYEGLYYPTAVVNQPGRMNPTLRLTSSTLGSATLRARSAPSASKRSSSDGSDINAL